MRFKFVMIDMTGPTLAPIPPYIDFLIDEAGEVHEPACVLMSGTRSTAGRDVVVALRLIQQQRLDGEISQNTH